MPRPETVHVTAPAALSRPMLSSQTLPQRSPFAIQELLGLSDSSRSTNANTNTSNTVSNGSSSGNGPVSAVTPSLYPNVGQSPFGGSDHHQMTMAASRMAYFNAHAAVAAAFLPHNMGGTGTHLGFHSQASGESSFTFQPKINEKKNKKIVTTVNNIHQFDQYLLMKRDVCM